MKHEDQKRRNFAVGHFHNEEMGVSLELDGNYMEASKLKDVRLYLLTKKVIISSDESDYNLFPMITHA